MARQPTKTDQIISRVLKHFDAQVGGLSKSEYLDVLQGTISILEGYEDCVREEIAAEAEGI